VVRALTRLLVAAMVLIDAPRDAPVHHELLQSKVGEAEYSAATLRLSFRDPVRDARSDLARGDLDIYCTGTIACDTGVDFSISVPDGLVVHSVASTGCIITGGEAEEQYRKAETEYVRVYNRTKVELLRARAPGRSAG
jgi:hypothetical protein